MTEDIEGAMECLTAQSPDAPASVLGHVARTVVLLSEFGTERPIDYFEPFSYIVKESEYPKPIRSAIPEQPVFDPLKEQKQNSMLASHLFARQRLTAEGEEEEDDKEETEDQEEHEEPEEENEGEFSNLLEEMRLLEIAGLGLPENETRLLQLSINRLIKSKPLETARFWGKFETTTGCYYIAEAEFKEGERPRGDEEAETDETEEKPEENENPEDQPVPMEEDSGPNQYSYFALTQFGGTWHLLPDVLPRQIVASRSIRQMLSGDLKHPVEAPEGRFEGVEENLLRCQIARMSHTGSIAPAGLWVPEEEPEEDQELDSNAPISENEEYEYKPINSLSQYVHRLPCILPQGRVEFYIPEGIDEEDLPEPEKGPPILRPLSQDEPVGRYPPWCFKQINGLKRCNVIRSLVWPGLYIVSTEKGEKLYMVYFGWGMKATDPLPWPPLPEPKPVETPEEDEEEENLNDEEEGDTETETKATEDESETTYETSTDA